MHKKLFLFKIIKEKGWKAAGKGQFVGSWHQGRPLENRAEIKPVKLEVTVS